MPSADLPAETDNDYSLINEAVWVLTLDLFDQKSLPDRRISRATSYQVEKILSPLIKWNTRFVLSSPEDPE